ncbi:MAG: hypothetical protein P8Y24_04660 [Gammaproteobacteria bacterium]
MSVVRFHLRPPFFLYEVTILDTRAINHCIEQLCSDGCRTVNDYIMRLESGEVLPQTSQLDKQERLEVLRELKAIMAVYKTCD